MLVVQNFVQDQQRGRCLSLFKMQTDELSFGQIEFETLSGDVIKVLRSVCLEFKRVI